MTAGARYLRRGPRYRPAFNGTAAAAGAPVFAALDLGTNNCRLLVARPAADGFRVIDAFSRIVRLGEGVGASGCLSEAAIERTLDALRVCARKMRLRGVTHGRSVATEACRQAGNCTGFLDRVRHETGIKLEIISTHEEAQLALAGCRPLLDGSEPHALVFDIGGGSTELIWLTLSPGGPVEIHDTLSIPCGVVCFAERYGGDVIDAQVYEAMVADVAARLASFEAANGIRDKIASGLVQMLGTSGTVTTIAGVHKQLPRYDRALVDGCHLTFDEIAAANRQLVGLDYRGRAALACIGPDRADLVVAGSAILEAICRTWPVGRLRVADRGLREGILLNLMRDAALAGVAG
ncbi:MAG: Ppx/GppA phosphatase family protein [Candidatus Eiseniibacteriota bacterium]